VRQLVVLRVCMVVGGGQVYIFQLVAGGQGHHVMRFP
jgi:hypothetical protein